MNTEVGHADRIIKTFYTVERAGCVMLSDGGGPFGFDITVAFQIDELIRQLDPDGIIETGCAMGDTTSYLSRMYPDIPLYSCDVDPTSAFFTRHRLCESNVTIEVANSPEFLKAVAPPLRRPLVYLDAHWGEYWPLKDELQIVNRGVVAIDDFKLGHPRFGYDTYNGIECSAPELSKWIPKDARAFVGNPFATYPAPCLQVGRRTGVLYTFLDPQPNKSNLSTYFSELKRSGGNLSNPEWGDYSESSRSAERLHRDFRKHTFAEH